MAETSMKIKDVVDKLTTQHEQALQIVQEFSTILEDVSTVSTAVRAKGFMDKLGSLLDVHLKIEDKLLYPILKKSPNQKVRDTAVAFSNEMGDIATVLGHYMEKWGTSIKIAGESEDFIKETKALVSVLGERIDRENNELFPLLISTSGSGK